MVPLGPVHGKGGLLRVDAASALLAASSPTTAVDGGTTAGVASQYGAVSLVGFVLAAVAVLYLWWRHRRGA